LSAVLLDIHILLRWLDDDPRFGAYEVALQAGTSTGSAASPARPGIVSTGQS
jgi:hypothetical protein